MIVSLFRLVLINCWYIILVQTVHSPLTTYYRSVSVSLQKEFMLSFPTTIKPILLKHLKNSFSIDRCKAVSQLQFFFVYALVV